jgi:hypothetical protein
MSGLIKGFIHVHSEFSRDGLLSVADLADFARESRFRFVGITDHAEDLEPEDRKSLRRQCEENSDDACVMIPGLEFCCDGDVHILGLGITGDLSGPDPVALAAQIREAGGVAILAHPSRNGYQCPQELYRVLSGVEVWNAAYDGRFVPPLANLRLLQEARTTHPAVAAFGGADLHALYQPPGVVVQLRLNSGTSVDAGIILQELESGNFTIRGKYLRFDGQKRPHPLSRFPLWAFRKLYEVSRAIRDAAMGNA